MSKIESIADNFVNSWCHKSQDKDDFKAELIDMISDIHKEYIVASIKNEVCGPNLHSEFKDVMSEFNAMKKLIKKFTDENIINIEKTKKELSEQLQKTKKVSTPKSSLGPYSSKTAKDFAEENKIDPNTVVGTGKEGKITKTDLNKALKETTGKTASKKSKKGDAKSEKLCNGTTAAGDPCKSSGKVNIKGKWYCNRHKTQAEVCENVDSDDEYGNYDDKKESETIDRFRDQSIKSLETVDDQDIKLNDMIGEDDENENPKDEDEDSDLESVEDEDYE